MNWVFLGSITPLLAVAIKDNGEVILKLYGPSDKTRGHGIPGN